MPATDTAGSALAEALSRAENVGDRWIPDALTSAAAAHDVSFLKAAARLKTDLPRVRDVVAVIAVIWALRVLL